MNKPSTIAYREFVEKIQQALDTANLPAFVIIPVLRDALAQLVQLDEQQYKRDEAEYRAALQGDKETDEG